MGYVTGGLIPRVSVSGSGIGGRKARGTTEWIGDHPCLKGIRQKTGLTRLDSGIFTIKLRWMDNYSTRKVLTGFAAPARMACMPTVRSAMHKATNPVMAKTSHPIGIR